MPRDEWMMHDAFVFLLESLAWAVFPGMTFVWSIVMMMMIGMDTGDNDWHCFGWTFVSLQTTTTR
jgi:hypothetical protein